MAHPYGYVGPISEERVTCKKPPSDDGSDYDTDSENEAPVQKEIKEKEPKKEVLPDTVDHFLGQLYEALKMRNVLEIYKLYEDTFNKLTEKHYKNTRWPSVATVKAQIAENELFLILYKELYYRHIFSRLSATVDERRGAWENYSKLLQLLVIDMSDDKGISVALPAQWLWDILDEFVYHYQTYCAFRCRAVKIQKEQDIKKLKEHSDVFDTAQVFAFLQSLVKESHIEEWLTSKGKSDKKKGAFSDESARLIGYFSLMQLLRLHSILGDYWTAMKTIENIDFAAEVPLFYKIPACHFTLYYYMGFAYLMLRRYVDAVKMFSEALAFMSKTSGMNALSYQYDAMAKKQEQMFNLLMLCLALSPQHIDESLEKTIKDRFMDKQLRLQRGEHAIFEELFSYSCPKFVSPAPPNYDSLDTTFDATEAHKRMKELFMQEVKQQEVLPKIASSMKLYTSLKLAKLAQLCEVDEETLRNQLMCVMLKARQGVRTTNTAPLDGEVQNCSEVEFYLDVDTVHINSVNVHKPHAEVFLENILKFQEVLRKASYA